MVGTTGFEPATSWSQTKCSTGLSYVPNRPPSFAFGSPSGKLFEVIGHALSPNDSDHPMKLVVFAHVPPPHHGQSQMVKLMVDGFAAEPSLGIQVLHVDARLSEGMSDIGAVRGGKIRALVGFCRQALRLSRDHGCRSLYYIPSPPKRSSLYRDFLVMALVRWRFQRLILHWHAVGLGAWLQSEAW